MSPVHLYQSFLLPCNQPNQAFLSWENVRASPLLGFLDLLFSHLESSFHRLVQSHHWDFNSMATTWRGFHLSNSLNENLPTHLPCCTWWYLHAVILMAFITIWIVSLISLFTCFLTSHPPCMLHMFHESRIVLLTCIPAAMKSTWHSSCSRNILVHELLRLCFVGYKWDYAQLPCSN